MSPPGATAGYDPSCATKSLNWQSPPNSGPTTIGADQSALVRVAGSAGTVARTRTSSSRNAEFSHAPPPFAAMIGLVNESDPFGLTVITDTAKARNDARHVPWKDGRYRLPMTK